MLAGAPWDEDKVFAEYVDWFVRHPGEPLFRRVPEGIVVIEPETKAGEFNWPILASTVLGADSSERWALRWSGWTTARARQGHDTVSLAELVRLKPSLGSPRTVYNLRKKALIILAHKLNNQIQAVIGLQEAHRRGRMLEIPFPDLRPRPEMVRQLDAALGLTSAEPV